MGNVGLVSREKEQVNLITNQPIKSINRNHMYKVLNNGQLHAICEGIETAIALVRTLEMNIDRMLCHSPFTIVPADSE